jgi:hypothetical protein
MNRLADILDAGGWHQQGAVRNMEGAGSWPQGLFVSWRPQKTVPNAVSLLISILVANHVPFSTNGQIDKTTDLNEDEAHLWVGPKPTFDGLKQ